MTDESWVEKHRPDSFDDMQGNNKAIRQIKEWADDWSPGDEGILLVGDAGVGKTTTAYLLADYFDAPLNEINASSARKSEDIKAMAASMRTSPADNDVQVVLLDEVDNWHHAADKQPLYDALDSPGNPVVLTANDEYDTPSGIKRRVDTYEFKLGKRSRKAKLREIAGRENVGMDKQDAEKLAERPDLRSAINDLQTWSEQGVPPGSDNREWEMNDFGSVESLLKYGDEWKEALSQRTGNKGFRPQWAMMWADENLSSEFRGLEAGVAYDALSRADTRVETGFDSQARGMPYAAALVSLLPDARLSEVFDGWMNVDFPSWVQSNKAGHDGDTPAAKLYQAINEDRGYQLAGSFTTFKHQYLPVLKTLDREERFELILEHGVDEEAFEALDVDEDEYLDWAQDKDPETGEWQPTTQSAADW